MAAATYSSFDPSPADVRRLNRAIRWSIVAHLVAIVVVLATPRNWWRSTPEPRTVMTINLGGTPGPSSTGQTSMGGRTIEQVAPPPPRPEPARPTTPAPPAPTSAPAVRAQPPPPTPAAPPRPTPPRPTTTTRPQADAPRVTGRTPVTGAQPSRGNTRVETGARGQGAGLSFGGGVSGGETDLANFCCPEYLALMSSLIDSRWNKNFPERGTTTLRFVIRRDGSINDVTVQRSSGYSTLDRAARAAMAELRLPALPQAYPNETLTINLDFNYGL